MLLLCIPRIAIYLPYRHCGSSSLLSSDDCGYCYLLKSCEQPNFIQKVLVSLIGSSHNRQGDGIGEAGGAIRGL